MKRSVKTSLYRRVRPDINGCWLWLGALDKDGYGKAEVAGENGWAEKRSVRAHRLSYEIFVGPIPEGLHIDHLCRNPRCINPKHLEPVTPRENVMRCEGLAAKNRLKTECKHGHLFTEENTYRYVWRGRECRGCKECRRKRTREAKRARVAKLRSTAGACGL